MESVSNIYQLASNLWGQNQPNLRLDEVGHECQNLRRQLDQFNLLVGAAAGVGYVVLGTLGAFLGGAAAYCYPKRRRLVSLYRAKQHELRQLFEQTLRETNGVIADSSQPLWKEYGRYLPSDFTYCGNPLYKTAFLRAMRLHAPQTVDHPNAQWTETLKELYEFAATH